MSKKQRSAITLLGLPLYPALLVLFIITYLMLRFLKKPTIQNRIVGALTDAGVSPLLAQIVFAQACHETGNFTSPLFFSNNNCFGMKPPTDYVIAIGEQFGYANYNSIEDSATAMAIWLQAHYIEGIQTVTNYVNNLYNANYFEASLQDYLSGVTYFYNMYYGTN
jgi:hypothetical protein